MSHFKGEIPPEPIWLNPHPVNKPSYEELEAKLTKCGEWSLNIRRQIDASLVMGIDHYSMLCRLDELDEVIKG